MASSPDPLTIAAPISGVTFPLEQVPDPVFSAKMVGDGISIDPTENLLVAPCEGTVVTLHPAGHALTLQTRSGASVLMHIGLDTVKLEGKGFIPKVAKGDTVSPGDPLIEFNLDEVAIGAKSLLTQIVIEEGEQSFRMERAPAGQLVEAGNQTVLTLTPEGDSSQGGTETSGDSATAKVSEAILIPNHTGLHARPAAVLAALAKKYQSTIRLSKGNDEANARSVTGIMGLNVSHGDKVQLVVNGPDADVAIEELSAAIASGLGDEGTSPLPSKASIEQPEEARPVPARRSEDPNILLGVSASPGFAVGQIHQVRQVEIEVIEAGSSVQQERETLSEAIRKATIELESLHSKLHASGDPAKAAIFAAHLELLEDPDLLDIAESGIAKGKSAAFAWKKAYATHAERLASLRNELLAARANDLRDVGSRVLRRITGQEETEADYPENAILIAEDLTPSDTAQLDQSRVRGFCTTGGGATSHVAILARSLNIPAVAGIEAQALDLENGTTAILDGKAGSLRINVSDAEVEDIHRKQEAAEALRKEQLSHALEPATSKDGRVYKVLANIGGAKEASESLPLGADGVGLLRSEFLFLERDSAPSEEEQFETYSEVAGILGDDRGLIIRTLDVGGDKPLSYLPIPKEDNPFLGERGIRVGLDRPEIFRTQLRALLRASEKHPNIRVMFPMIATLSDWQAGRGLFLEEAEKLGIQPPQLGIMIEVPAAALLAEKFAEEADFFSIGTNDLTQYTLAMDRGHPKLAAQIDALAPAVLRLIAQTVEGAAGHDRSVGVCGGIASDEVAAPILLGLGVKHLSVSVPSIPSIKAEIRTHDIEKCRELAKKALDCRDGAEVRELVTQFQSS